MLCKQERALIIQWHEKNLSIRSISQRLGVSRNTVRRWVRADGETE